MEYLFINDLSIVYSAILHSRYIYQLGQKHLPTKHLTLYNIYPLQHQEICSEISLIHSFL